MRQGPPKGGHYERSNYELSNLNGGLQEGLDDLRGHWIEFHPEADRRLRVRNPAEEADEGAAEGHPDRDGRPDADRRARFDVTAGRGQVAEPRRGRTGHAVDPAFDENRAPGMQTLLATHVCHLR